MSELQFVLPLRKIGGAGSRKRSDEAWQRGDEASHLTKRGSDEAWQRGDEASHLTKRGSDEAGH